MPFDLPEFIRSLGALEHDLEVVKFDAFAKNNDVGTLYIKMPNYDREARVTIVIQSEKNLFALYADLDLSTLMDTVDAANINRLHTIINAINFSTLEFSSKISIHLRRSGELVARITCATHLPSEYFSERVEALRAIVRQNLMLIIDEGMTMIASIFTAWVKPSSSSPSPERVLN